jgi:hypothetical protein
MTRLDTMPDESRMFIEGGMFEGGGLAARVQAIESDTHCANPTIQ